tara:strand:- start:211 stop:693 length:483 start_codon:yes stop_codon:yes gene_type:complete
MATFARPAEAVFCESLAAPPRIPSAISCGGADDWATGAFPSGDVFLASTFFPRGFACALEDGTFSFTIFERGAGISLVGTSAVADLRFSCVFKLDGPREVFAFDTGDVGFAGADIIGAVGALNGFPAVDAEDEAPPAAPSWSAFRSEMLMISTDESRSKV